MLDHYAPPARVRKVERLLAAGDVQRRDRKRRALGNVSAGATTWPPAIDDSPLAADIRSWPREAPDAVSPRAISRAFGTPKPTLANSYQPELLNLRTFPTLMGYSSRILAESWESNLLYYAALADEIHVAAGGVERSGSGVDRSRPWSRSSPRIWKIGRRCCDRCAWWATMSGRKRASSIAAADN